MPVCAAVSALSVQYSTELAGTCRALMFHVNFRLPVLIPPEQLLVAITGRIYTILEDEGRHGAVLLYVFACYHSNHIFCCMLLTIRIFSC